MSRIVTLKDYSDIPKQATEWVVAFVVGFVKLSGTTEQDATLGGSGTLIQADGKFAILTADHVLSNLPTRGDLGLVLPRIDKPVIDRHILKAEHVKYVSVGKASLSANGPDLGYVLLPEKEARRLEVNRAFYSVSRRRASMLEQPRPTDYGGWFLAGMVHEWTEDVPGELGFGKVKKFTGSFGAGVVSEVTTDERFDYLNFEARFGDLYDGPKNYQGTSGGGLWQMVVEERAGVLTIRDGLLSGVAYYQSVVPGGIDIKCHGRKSVYAEMYDMLMQS